MLLAGNAKVIDIMERALNLVSPQIIDHGKRVAYGLFKELYPLGLYEDKQLRDICILGLLHDVGAYKTEDIDSIIGLDTENKWNHSVYGYLFLKYFSPIKSLAPVVLFHHADDCQMVHLSEEHQKLTQLLKLLDRADIHQYFNKDMTYMDHAGMADLTDTDDIDEDMEFNRIFRYGDFSSEAVEAYLKMIVFSIDFRSPQTMIHTFAATHTAEALARLAGVDESQIKSLKAGAMMHDIGKMGTPLRILESINKKLSPSDMEIMKKHVVFSEDILLGCVDDKILNIAVNHHEKLNGQGYPKGLDKSSLAYLDRLMAVADVFSAISVPRSYQEAFPKEKAVKILSNFKDKNLLDQSIIELAVTHYDEIINSLNIKSKPVIAAYEAIAEESCWIHNKIADGQYDIVI